MPDGRGQEIKYILNNFSVRNSTANLRTLYACASFSKPCFYVWSAVNDGLRLSTFI